MNSIHDKHVNNCRECAFKDYILDKLKEKYEFEESEFEEGFAELNPSFQHRICHKCSLLQALQTDEHDCDLLSICKACKQPCCFCGFKCHYCDFTICKLCVTGPGLLRCMNCKIIICEDHAQICDVCFEELCKNCKHTCKW